jgi:hypothetical protein
MCHLTLFFWAMKQSIMAAGVHHVVARKQREKRYRKGPGQNAAPRTCPSDLLPPTRPSRLKFPARPKIVSGRDILYSNLNSLVFVGVWQDSLPTFNCLNHWSPA